MELAHAYWIYGVVCMAFLIPAEKLLRKFFGFDNAGTLSAAGSFAGGALFSTMLQRISRPKSGGKGGGKDNGKKNPRMQRGSNTRELIDTDAEIIGGDAGQTIIQPLTGGTGASAEGRQNTGNSIDANRVRNEAAARAMNGGNGTPQSTQPSTQPSNSPSFKLNRTNTHPTVRGRLSKGKLGLTLDNMARTAEIYYGNKLINGARSLPKTAGRLVRKAVVGGLAGGTLAITGAAVGAASGDAGSAMKLGTAAAAAGYYGANYYGDKYAEHAGEVYNIERNAFWGEELKARNQYLADEAAKTDLDDIQMVAQFVGSMEAAQEAVDNGAIQWMREQGIEDSKYQGRVLRLAEELMKPHDGDPRHQGITDYEKALTHATAYGLQAQRAPDNVTQSGSHSNKVFVNDRIQKYMSRTGLDKDQAKEAVKNELRIIGFFKDGVFM